MQYFAMQFTWLEAPMAVEISNNPLILLSLAMDLMAAYGFRLHNSNAIFFLSSHNISR